jgi:amino acid adenylation domain-containing protein
LTRPTPQETNLEVTATAAERPQAETEVSDLDYWRHRLTPQPELLSLPIDHALTTEGAFAAARVAVDFPDDLALSLRAGIDHGLFATLLSGWQILLWRLSGNADPVTLIPACLELTGHNDLRSHHGGTLLPIRAAIDPAMRAEDYLATLETVVFKAYQHRNVSDDTIVHLVTPATREQTTLSKVQFSFEKASAFDSRKVMGATENRLDEADLSINIVAAGAGFHLECDYNASLFKEETIRLWLDCYCTLLSAMLIDPSQIAGTLPLLDPEKSKYLLVDCNATAAEPLPSESVPELLADAFAAMPTQPAAEFYGLVYSRTRLTERSDRLASWLLRHGISCGSLVGIHMDRSLEMLVAVLAVLKAGAAYVPLDPKFPLKRLEQITDETRIPILLTLARHLDDLPKFGGRVLCLDREAAELMREPLRAFPHISREMRAYVIFTSGSTGRPKGVEVTHGSVVNLLIDVKRRLDIGPQDRLLAITTLAFDISVLELLLPLVSGGTVVIATQEDAADGLQLMDLLTATRATVLQATPFTWRTLLEFGYQPPPGLKMLCGGEAWLPAMGEKLLAGGARLWNMYGPTETTVWSSVTEFQRGTTRVTIGPPLANTRFYVLDERLQPVPPGVPGELMIAGAGVARGYFQQKELTAEKFLADPYIDGEKMYRSGDEVRQLPDGRMEFLRRIDQQIKLRGFRVELGEIEAAMLEIPKLRGAIVVLRKDTAGEDMLAGYYTADGELSAVTLREWLQGRLPAYMIPKLLRQLEAFPLTANGKIDRRRLQELQETQSDSTVSIEEIYSFDAMDVESQTRQRMFEIWRKIFEGEDIRSDSNFFDLGGDSLLLVRLQSVITREFGVHLTMADITHHLTLGALSTWVGEMRLNADANSTARPTNPRVLPVHSRERGRPIFLIPQMTIFWTLAELLGVNQPVYALQMLDEDVPLSMDSANLEQLAMLYCNLIREVQPEGPYRLGGWCLWGLLAYEVARLLEKEGAEIELLMIIDTWAPNRWIGHLPLRRFFLNIAHSAHRLNRIANRLRRSSMEKRKQDVLRRLRDTATTMARLLPQGVRSKARVAEVSRIERLVSNAAAVYQPGEVKGTVLLFKGEQQPTGRFIGEDMSWTQVLRRKVHIDTLPGNHSEIFDLPGASIMAARVREALNLELA